MNGNVKIILSGANGGMGGVVAQYVAGRDGVEISAGIDRNTDEHAGFFVFAEANLCDMEGDVIIDFSSPESAVQAAEFAAEKSIPIVVATTGLSGEQLAKIKEASKKVPVFLSANLSLGVNLLIQLVKKAAMTLGEDFDIEIVEKHHNKKIDAPSGTALMIADAISNEQGDAYNYVYDRHSVRKRREKTEIGISSVRGGTISGEHEVIFAGTDEILSIEHRAMSKTVFAAGAVNAALFIIGKPAGMYDMSDLI